jgi:hypothetical protein
MAGRAGAPDAAHAALRYHYRDLARSLADIGSIASGSLTRGLTHCNKPRVPAVGPTRLACTAPTGGGRPSYKARPSAAASANAKPSSTPALEQGSRGCH